MSFMKQEDGEKMISPSKTMRSSGIEDATNTPNFSPKARLKNSLRLNLEGIGSAEEPQRKINFPELNKFLET